MPSPNDLSFLPDDYVAARRRARANRIYGSLLAVVIVGVAGAFWWAERSLNQIRQEHVQVNADFDRETERLQRLDQLQKQQQAVTRRANLAEALVERVPRTELLAELVELLPDNSSLVEIVMSSKVRPIIKTPEQLLAEKQATRDGKAVQLEPEPKRYDTSLKLGGIAYTDLQVAQFINRLSQSVYFDDVNLLLSREFKYDGQMVRRFDVEMTVRAEPKHLPAAAGSDPVVSTEALLSR